MFIVAKVSLLSFTVIGAACTAWQAKEESVVYHRSSHRQGHHV